MVTSIPYGFEIKHTFDSELKETVHLFSAWLVDTTHCSTGGIFLRKSIIPVVMAGVLGILDNKNTYS